MVARLEKKAVVLGTGVVNWPGAERRCDRYGFILLNKWSGGYYGKKDMPRKPEPDTTGLLIDEAKKCEGQRGVLVAHVLKTRKSQHCGDVFHGIVTKRPAIGAEILLGRGTLLTSVADGDDGEWFHIVGLKPDDGRPDLWLDIKQLYRAHDQTVRLEFVPEA